MSITHQESPTQKQIADRAYEIYLERGRQMAEMLRTGWQRSMNSLGILPL
jgi:hypothetical protein